MSNTKLLYKQIMHDYERLIISNEYSPGDQIPTELEIAEKYNVSRITAIRAVKELELQGLVSRTKGKGTFVNDPSLWAVNRPHARPAAAPSPFRFLSLVLPYDEHFGYQILQGVEKKAKEQGYYVTFHNSAQSVAKEREILLKLLDDGVKGVIVYPVQSGGNVDIFGNMLIRKFPFVVIDRVLNGLQVPHVVSDHFQGTYGMVRYLLELGHRNIAFVSQSRTEAVSIMERFKGYCQALIEASVPLEQDYVVDTTAFLIPGAPDADNAEDEVAKRTLRYLAELPARPTAVVAVNDLTAIPLIRNAPSLGWKVPEDVSIAGFDNINICEHIEVPLTTVEQSFITLGEQAAEMIMSQIRDGIDPLRKVVLDTRLVVRQSCAPPTAVQRQ